MKKIKFIFVILFIYLVFFDKVSAIDNYDKEILKKENVNSQNTLKLNLVMNNLALTQNIKFGVFEGENKVLEVESKKGILILDGLKNDKEYILRVLDKRFKSADILIRNIDDNFKALNNEKVVDSIDIKATKDGIYELNFIPAYVTLASNNKKSQFIKIDGKTYYLDENSKLTMGWKKIYDTYYYFDEKGQMQIGWLKLGSSWFYLAYNGAMQTGWQNLSGDWYYLDSYGYMRTGWIKYYDKWYYLDGSGKMKTGWLKLGNSWFYLAYNGAMQTGWQSLSGDWYYLDNSGYMKTGWHYDKKYSSWYYLLDSGRMASNKWIYTDGWYYLMSNGKPANDWIIDDGFCYYFHSNGKLMYDSNGNYAGWKIKGNKLFANGLKDIYDVGSNYIVVSIYKQRLWLVRSGKLVHNMGIITGRPDRPTVKGRFSIQYFESDVYLNGGETPAWVHRWMPFYYHYGIHDARWQPKGGFYDQNFYKKYGSHGCVNVEPSEIDKIWNNSYKGMPVVVLN